jgi:hypothetical protein
MTGPYYTISHPKHGYVSKNARLRAKDAPMRVELRGKTDTHAHLRVKTADILSGS